MVDTYSVSQMSPQTVVIVAVVVIFIIGRQLVTRTIRPWTIFIYPVVALVGLFVSLPGAFRSAGMLGVISLIVGLALGASLGVVRAAASRLSIDPATRRLIIHGSIWSPLLYVAVLSARIAIGYFTVGAPAPMLDAVTVGLLGLSVAMITARSVTLLVKYLQASRSFAQSEPQA